MTKMRLYDRPSSGGGAASTSADEPRTPFGLTKSELKFLDPKYKKPKKKVRGCAPLIFGKMTKTDENQGGFLLVNL